MTKDPVKVYLPDLLDGSYYIGYKWSEALGKFAEILEERAEDYRDLQFETERKERS